MNQADTITRRAKDAQEESSRHVIAESVEIRRQPDYIDGYALKVGGFARELRREDCLRNGERTFGSFLFPAHRALPRCRAD
jgi:hypothetical protein